MIWQSLARRFGLVARGAATRGRRVVGRRPQLEALEGRIVLNNRFVVPRDLPADNATTFHQLAQALVVAGLNPGDIIQIEPGSTPGAIDDLELPSVTNLTIRGHAGFGARDLPAISTTSALTVGAAQAGLRLENLNLNLSGGGVTLTANAVLQSNHIVFSSPAGGDVISLHGTTAAVLRNNTILSETGASTVIEVQVTGGASNLIAGNTVSVRDNAIVLSYSGAGVVTDRVEDNTFFGIDGFFLGRIVLVHSGVNGLTLQRNTFRDNDTFVDGLVIDTAVNIQVLDNVFDFPGADADNVAIRVVAQIGQTTSVIIAQNQFRGGTGISFTAPSSGTLSARVEGNNFLGNAVGVLIGSAGATVAGIDLGGGGQGSLGANNFRRFTAVASSTSGAIVMAAGSGASGVMARNNLFGTGSPETSVFDNEDNSGRASVTTTSAVTGNAAFVQALYLKFLRRVGNLASPSDAGAWVNVLNSGTPASVVAGAIVRSQEALGLVVDDLYRRVLGRGADAGGRAGWVNALAAGTTLEQVQANLYASTEYRLRYAGEAAFIASLYQGLLGRTPSVADIDGWRAVLPALGRAGVAAAFLGSAEHRARFVSSLYRSLLKRPAAPAPAEVTPWVNSGQGMLALTVIFASTGEFQAVG